MQTEQATQQIAILGAVDPVSQGAGAVNSPSIDFSKVKRGLFVLDVGVFGASATVDMKLQVSPDNSAWTDAASAVPALSNVSITQLAAAGGNNKQASIEVRAEQLAALTTPAKARYARVVVTVGTAATLVSVVCLGLESMQRPCNQFNQAGVVQQLVAS